MLLVGRSTLRKRTPNWPVVPSKKEKNKVVIFKFDVQVSLHRKYVPKYIQQDATLHKFF